MVPRSMIFDLYKRVHELGTTSIGAVLMAGYVSVLYLREKREGACVYVFLIIAYSSRNSTFEFLAYSFTQ